MFIIGNAALMENEKNGIWPSVIEELREHDRIGEGFPIKCKNHPELVRTVESADELRIVAPNGGCNIACGHGMPCGHICPLQCHPDDKEHRLVKCFQPCDRLHPICQHACPKQCGEPCGDCTEFVGSMVLACSHILEKPRCHQKKNPSTIVCRVKVTRKLPTCEHEQRCDKNLNCGHQCPSVCGEICPPQKFCVECKDPETMGMQVDMIMMANLGETDVDDDPILVLSCSHAWTMSTLDGMMEMGNYYESEIDPETEETTYIAKRPLPGNEVSQVSCPSCRMPIMRLFRYGRRIKDAQLSMRLKKHQMTQENSLVDAKGRCDVAIVKVETGHEKFLSSLSKISADQKIDPPKPMSRKLGKFAQESEVFPDTRFLPIAEPYGIPPEHRTLWGQHIHPLVTVIKMLNDINMKAAKSPTKKLYKAAVSHLYRLKARAAPLLNEDQFIDSIYPDDHVEQDAVSTMIQQCILECGLPADGNGGSSFVESLAEKITILQQVLSEASFAMEAAGALTGWYWFVEDLRTCCLIYTYITMEAAMKGHYYRRVAFSRIAILDLLCHQVRWLGLRPLPDNKPAKDARFKLTDDLIERFMAEQKELGRHCPPEIKDDCMDRSSKIEERMVTAVKMARGELTLNQPLTKAEKMQVFRAMATTLGGTGHWYRCPNGHPYVIGECGRAMQ
ncbi:hypothetical protein BGZ82_007221 [Podila clonocystis]|nr:hypothetical protein BGZ82_007221 [Podila clonocystis]